MNLLEVLEDLQDEPEKKDDIGDMPGQISFFQPLTQNQIRNIGENIEHTIKCTPDHQILTNNRGYVRADELTEDDDIVVRG